MSIIHHIFFFSFFNLLSFLTYPNLSYFRFYYYSSPWTRKLVVFQKKSIKTIHSNTEETCFIILSFSYIHLSRLELIINILLPIKTRKTSQIQMTSTHVQHHGKKNSVQATSPSTYLMPLNATLPIASVK